MKTQISITEAIRRSNGIVEHEFSDDVVASCEKGVNAMFARIEAGQSTFEEEDALLMKQWNELQRNKG